LVVLHPLVHRRIGPLPADEDRLDHTADRFAGLGVLFESGLRNRLDDLELRAPLTIGQHDLVNVCGHLASQVWNTKGPGTLTIISATTRLGASKLPVVTGPEPRCPMKSLAFNLQTNSGLAEHPGWSNLIRR